LVGIVSAKDCRKAADRGEKDLRAILNSDIKKVMPDVPAHNLFAFFGGDTPAPVAVVNEEDHLVGVVVVGSLLSKLAETSQVDTNGEEQ
jgi:glycine betaine/proline transport system ATP-binding protein